MNITWPSKRTVKARLIAGTATVLIGNLLLLVLFELYPELRNVGVSLVNTAGGILLLVLGLAGVSQYLASRLTRTA